MSTKCVIADRMDLMKRYLDGKDALSNDEREILLFSLYIESRERKGLAHEAIKQMDVFVEPPKPAPATPSATPLREANQQRVDAAAQRVRQAMDYRKYLPGDPFRKDVELLIEIALAPVLEIFAAAQPATTPMAAPAARLEEAEWWRGRSDGIHPRVCTCEMCQRLKFLRAAAQPQRESERMTIHKLADLLLRDMVCRNGCPKCTASACSELAGHCSCTCHATWTALDEAVHRERESEQPEQALREAVDDWAEAHQRLDHSGITDCTRCKRIAEIRSGFKLAALSPQTDSQEPR